MIASGGTNMRAGRLLATSVALALAAAACGNSKSQSGSTTTQSQGGAPQTTASAANLTKFVPSNQAGVDDAKREIRVAVITSKTNPLGGKYVQYTDGVKAYFKLINDHGGIYGRKLVIAKERDDIIGTQNAQQVTASLSDDNAFATFVATLQFTGADALAKAGQPTFIWNINPEMASTPQVAHTNIFGSLGALCFNCGGHFLPWLVTKEHYTKVGILAYGVSASSKICAAGTKKGYQLFTPNVKVAFFDDTIPFSGDLAADVAKMKAAGVQFVTTCMDTNEVAKLAKEMKQQGLNATQNLPNAYDHDSLGDPTTAALFENDFVEPQNSAWEDTPQSPATQEYLTAVKAITTHPVELTESGWIMAKMFVDGLKGAGPEFTKQKVIAYLNSQTAYSADGLIVPIDWTKQHNDPQSNLAMRGKYECATVTQIKAGKFVPLFTEPGKPWICFDPSPKAPIPTEPQHMSFAPGGKG